MPTIPYETVRDQLAADPDFRGIRRPGRGIRHAGQGHRRRVAAGKTQAQVAEQGISQPAVAKIEAGQVKNLDSLRRYATTVGCGIKIEFVPLDGK